MKFTLNHTLQTLVPTFGIAMLLCTATQAVAEDWQEKILFNPPESQIRLEQRGRVMIYDGLTDKQVEKAMDTQFDRIGSMMFVRTVITDETGSTMHDSETGEVMIEDDGC